MARQEKCYFMQVSNHAGFGPVTELCTSLSVFQCGVHHRTSREDEHGRAPGRSFLLTGSRSLEGDNHAHQLAILCFKELLSSYNRLKPHLHWKGFTGTGTCHTGKAPQSQTPLTHKITPRPASRNHGSTQPCYLAHHFPVRLQARGFCWRRRTPASHARACTTTPAPARRDKSRTKFNL